MDQQETIQLPAFGRTFQLGTLYDARKDDVIPGMTLWDLEELKSGIYEESHRNSMTQVIIADSFQEKAHALKVEGSVKLSLVGGLIDVGGSANFINDSKKTNHVSRVTLEFIGKTVFRSLTMDQLATNKLKYPEVFDKNIATHVVTGILYGYDAYFVFDHQISKREDKNEVTGKLHEVIKKISTCDIDAEMEVGLKESEKNIINGTDCTFHGDCILPKNPSTIKEAIEIYNTLPALLKDNNGIGVPKRVWLYPLHLLDNKAMIIVRDISSNIIDYCISFLEDFHSLEIRALDLTKSSMFEHFNHMRKHLLDFVARLSELGRDLKTQMMLILPKVRGAGADESELLGLFKKVDVSPFNIRKLTSWVEDKEKEVSLIEQFIVALTKDKISNIIVKSSALDDVIGDIDYEYILCLSFRFTEENDPQLQDMLNYLQGQHDLNSREKSSAWFKDHDSLRKTRTTLRKFIDFVAGNVNSSNVKFIVNEEYPTDGVKQALLTLYMNGVPNGNFVVPSKPGAPQATNITEDSITIEWTDPQTGSQEVQHYKIMYRNVSVEKQVTTDENSPDPWTHVTTNDNTRIMSISNLSAGVLFVFKVQSVTKIGFSAISENSRSIPTLGSVKLTSENIEHLMHEINGLEEQEIKKLHATFYKLCSDGKMTKDIFKKAFQEIYPKGKTDRYCQYAFDIMDKNKDGILNFVEYVIAMHMHDSDDLEKSLGLVFDIFDYNKSGTIDEKELICMITTTGELIGQPCDQKTAKKYAEEIVNVCDKSNKKTITKEDFVNGCKSFSKYWRLLLPNSDQIPINISQNSRWAQNGVTVAGGHGPGEGTNQLYRPFGLYVDENQTIYIADWRNDRIVQWKSNATSGQIVAGGNGEGNRLDQLNYPIDVIVDKETSSLIICDYGNRRVTKWSLQSGTTKGEILLENIDCCRLTMDDQRYLYVSDYQKHEVRRYRIGEKNGTLVAGGNGNGDRLNQLNYPIYLFVDREYSVYVSDSDNHRVMKWVKGATEGIVVAGGQGQGNSLNQLSYPKGVFVDFLGTVYVAEANNDRVTRWRKGVTQGEVTVGGNGEGKEANQLNGPQGLSFDQHGHLYVVDWGNHRVQRFSLKTS